MNSYDDWVVNNLTLAVFHKNFEQVSIDYVEFRNTHVICIKTIPGGRNSFHTVWAGKRPLKYFEVNNLLKGR